jgi:hypothetical protein
MNRTIRTHTAANAAHSRSNPEGRCAVEAGGTG